MTLHTGSFGQMPALSAVAISPTVFPAGTSLTTLTVCVRTTLTFAMPVDMFPARSCNLVISESAVRPEAELPAKRSCERMA